MSMFQNMSISIVGLITVGAMFSSYMLGRMQEIPSAKWRQGGFFQGGAKPWRIVYFVFIGLALALNLLYPLLARSGLLSGVGMRGGYGGGYGGGGMYGGGY